MNLKDLTDIGGLYYIKENYNNGLLNKKINVDDGVYRLIDIREGIYTFIGETINNVVNLCNKNIKFVDIYKIKNC
ncbi:hypothetical protein FACS189450_10690 [Spirochaetia bacterium]|nr:hypothetical protein FACS189450_10690 [Spirochaetia bacterium]